MWSIEDGKVAAGSSIIITKKGPIVTGSIYSNKYGIGEVLRGFDREGNELWRKEIDTPLWDMSLGIAELPSGYILWGIIDFNYKSSGEKHTKEQSSGISIIKLDERGEIVASRRLSLTLPAAAPVSTNMKLLNDKMIVAIN